MEILLVSAIAFSLSQVCLSIVLLLRNPRSWSLQERLLLVFLICVTSYLITPLVSNPALLALVLLIQTALPGMFWLFSSSLFDDQFSLSRAAILSVAVTVLLPFIGGLLQSIDFFAPRVLFWTFPQALEFVFLGLAMLVMIRFWRIDLIQARRDLRLWFCLMTGLYIVTLLLLRELIFPDAEWLRVWQYMPVGGICLLTNILLLQYKPGLIDHTKQTSQDGTPKPIAPSDVEIPAGLVDQIKSLMSEQHVYREMGFTIGQLAEMLDLPEYRLRKIINAGMGYRNFNDFLNGYRIQEAGQRLSDPNSANLAVVNIALDTGFRSLSSFNKAFKAEFGQTPTQFRDKQGQNA